MATTIKDVAKLAGVSISTVSRVINKSKPVSPEARRKVLHAIDELEYEPNEVARSLVRRKSNLIGVIVDDIGDYYVAQIVRGIEEIGRMYNYDIILSSSYGSAETEMKFLQLLRTKQVEGIILVSEILNEELLEYVKELQVEFVYLNRFFAIPDLFTVSLDNDGAIKKMMDYLANMGHENILYLTCKNNFELSRENMKVKAYEKYMKDLGKDPIIHLVDGCEIYSGYNAGPNIWNKIKEDDVTAVFCCQDELAIGFMNYLHDNNITVPDDISVVGFGDINIASIYRPPLTT
ncbi:MAG TPA: LacI family DNA-binding transcriptional regulator, partial [Tissierellaceae bacterium]|nr:LacI family DNA-binding transcriptional regulator [Tissierellaceae bacterium]